MRRMFKQDLRALGMRTSAGEFRDRAGTPARGSSRPVSQRLRARDLGGALRRVSKLKASVLDGRLFELATARKYRNCWSNLRGRCRD
jgi:hypothetical protein